MFSSFMYLHQQFFMDKGAECHFPGDSQEELSTKFRLALEDKREDPTFQRVTSLHLATEAANEKLVLSILKWRGFCGQGDFI